MIINSRNKFFVTLGFVMTFMVASAHGLYQQLTPIEEGIPTYFPPTEQLSIVGEDVPEIGSNQTFDLMQSLRDEVRELRGVVDEMSFQLRELKQQQLDDYLDLDRRIGAAERKTYASDEDNDQNELLTADETGTGDVNVEPKADLDPQLQAQIREDYESASQKLLRDRDINGATLSLLAHIDRYPESNYVPNARYWLGEIYLLQEEVELARQQFTIILEQYQDHPKARDSSFKLGKIYFELGQLDLSKSLLRNASKEKGPIAEKALKFLDDNLSDK